MNKPPKISADTLNRVVKMALDKGEVGSLDDAYALFSSYRLGVAVSDDAAASAAAQAALLTIVNCGRRALLGGISVFGARHAPLLVDLPGDWSSLGEAVEALGATLVDELPLDRPALLLGAPPACVPELALRVTFGSWRAGVIPADEDRTLDEPQNDILAAIVAGAIGVCEIFQNLRGNPMAGRRSTGLSLWQPDARDWEIAEPGPALFVAPSRLWLMGLGHLGQAYLWTLGLLPFAKPNQVELTLQDFDRLTEANDSTSMLTQVDLLGRAKTRAMAEWVEQRGFAARLVERRFAGDVKLLDDDPRVLLCGVDNPAARAALEAPGFDLVVEAGLGAGPEEYLAIRMHAFPASRRALDLWRDEGAAAAASTADMPAYAKLASSGVDACGLVTIASRTVGAPFVGTVAAGLVIGEVLRRLNAGAGFEVIDLTLRNLQSREAVAATALPAAFNPGFTELRDWPRQQPTETMED